MSKTIERAIDTPKVIQNIQNAVCGSQSINTYQIQYNLQYQQIASETEKQITESLSDKEITPQEQKVINQTILFLGTKELFINYRQDTINNLMDCYNKLDKKESKLKKFTTSTASVLGITNKIVGIIPGGEATKAPIGIAGDIANFVVNIVQGKFSEKFTKQFQETLAKDEKSLSLFDGSYISLVNTVWGDNKAVQEEITSTIIKVLNLKKTELNPFSQSISDVWKGESLMELGDMKESIEAIIKDFDNLKQKLQDEKEQLSKQIWFKEIGAKTDLLQEQQLETHIEQPPK